MSCRWIQRGNRRNLSALSLLDFVFFLGMAEHGDQLAPIIYGSR